VFVNSGSGNGLAIHSEIGECLIGMAEETDGSSRDSLAGGDSCEGCLMRISRMVVEWGLIDSESAEDNPPEKIRTLVLEASGTGVYLSIIRVRSILSTYMVMERYLKSLTIVNKTKKASSSHSKVKKPGISMITIGLEGFLIQLMGPIHAEDMKVADPKKVNYGSQGGEEIVTKMADGSLRSASIYVARGDSLRSKYKTSLELAHLSLCLQKEPKLVSMKIERGCLLYQEFNAGEKVLGEATAFGVQSVEVLYQVAAAGSDKASCAVVSANDVTVRWEPDLHLFFHEVGLQAKRLLDWRKSFRNNLSSVYAKTSPVKDPKAESINRGERSSSKLQVAIDIEGLLFTAEVGDGVELEVKVQSIFSEDAQVGVLVENATLSLNSALVVSSERLQISRIPFVPEFEDGNTCVKDSASEGDIEFWDCIVHGTGTRILMPFRLPFRGIEDACEDMWRVLKLAMAAQKLRIGAGMPVPVVVKPKKKSRSQLRAVQLVLRDTVAEIEEEPIQGWFDEHHRLLRKQACELIVREQLFDERVNEERSKSGHRPSHSEGEEEKNNSALHKLVETGLSDPETVRKERDRLYIQAFEAYHKACKKLSPDEGSGAANVGLQAGFKPSVTRRSLASITANSLEVVLTKVDGGREGMIEIVRKLDCVEPDADIPFSRVMGRKLLVHAEALAVHIRDYTYPLLSADRGRCEGVVVLAQQVPSWKLTSGLVLYGHRQCSYFLLCVLVGV
jgi:hypothetical protein